MTKIYKLTQRQVRTLTDSFTVDFEVCVCDIVYHLFPTLFTKTL